MLRENAIILMVLISLPTISFSTASYFKENIPKTEFVEVSNIDFCKKEKDCALVAEAIVFEARSESLEGQRAVADVILNRVDHPRFPNNIHDVIHQRMQFSYLLVKDYQTIPTEEDWFVAYDIAYEAMYVADTSLDALFYLNPNKVPNPPRWAREFQIVKTIDNHVFYTYP